MKVIRALIFLSALNSFTLQPALATLVPTRCERALTALAKLEKLTPESIRTMTPSYYHALLRSAVLALSPANQRTLASNGTASGPPMMVYLKAETPKTFGRPGQRVPPFQNAPPQQQLNWRNFEVWREKLFELLKAQEAPPTETQEVGEPGNKIEFEGDVTRQWLQERLPGWQQKVRDDFLAELALRGIERIPLTAELSTRLKDWTKTLTVDRADYLESAERPKLVYFLNSLKFSSHPSLLSIAEKDPELAKAFRALETFSMESVQDLQRANEKLKPVLTPFRHHLVIELVTFLANSDETIVIPSKRKKNGDIIFVSPDLQLFVDLNPDGAVASLKIRFLGLDALPHFAPWTVLPRAQTVSESVPQSRVQQIPSPPSRSERMAMHANGWKVRSTVLTPAMQDALLALGNKHPTQRDYINDHLIPLLERERDLFEGNYAGRFIRKIDPIISNDDDLPTEERLSLLEAMIRSKRRSLEVEKQNGEASTAEQTSANDLHLFISGERGIAELQEGVVYDFVFQRTNQFGPQRVVFNRQALKFIKDDTHDLGSIFWLRALSVGIVPDTGMTGVKHRHWAKETPYEWEIKRMRCDWRLLMRKDSEGVWHVEAPHLEH